MAKSEFEPSSGKRNNLEYAMSWPKKIKKIVKWGLGIAALGYGLLTATGYVAFDYRNLSIKWKGRSQAIEKKVEYTGDAYIPLTANSSVLTEDLSSIINAKGLESITNIPIEGWLGTHLNTNLGAVAGSAWNKMIENPDLNIADIGFYVVPPDSNSAFTAALIRNTDGIELAIENYPGYNKEKSLEENIAKANEKFRTTLAEKGVVEGKLETTKGELANAQTTIQEKESQIKVYTDEEKGVNNDYIALSDKYEFSSVVDSVYLGLETKLTGDIKYNVKRDTVNVDGRLREGVIITYERKNMSLAEKQKNFDWLEKYLDILKQIEDKAKDGGSDFDMWKARPWKESLKVTITPKKNGSRMRIVDTSTGALLLTRNHLKYRVGNIGTRLKY